MKIINRVVSMLSVAAVLIFSVPMSSIARSEESVKGDLNADGYFNIADIVQLQKWLISATDSKLDNWTAADFNSDNIINSLDLSLMKKALINSSPSNTISVSSIEELFAAIENAAAGDVIEVAPGTYDYSSYQGAQTITASAEGSEALPITLKAAVADKPPIFTGRSTENSYVMHITGDWWVIENINFTRSQKGIVLDNSNNTVVRGCEVYNTGSEAIAVRDGSCNCTIEDCFIHDTGINTPGYGEGVYIGSAKSTSGFDYKCDNTLVKNCIFRNVAAEHIDVKEYTTGTEICGCTFYGDGMSGENYAGSFIDIAGNNVNVHDNTGYRNGNKKITAAFELHEQVQGWGYHCTFTGNTLYMDQPYGAEDTSRRMYVVDGWYSDFSVKNNFVDYGSGLTAADSWKYYNSDYVTYLN